MMTIQGCIRALGLQTKASIIAICCYYIISIPAAALLTFVGGFGNMGLWYGLYLGVIVQLILDFVLIVRADWRDLAWKAHVRIKREL